MILGLTRYLSKNNLAYFSLSKESMNLYRYDLYSIVFGRFVEASNKPTPRFMPSRLHGR